MFEQSTIHVTNLLATRRFYDAIAVPLGLGTLDIDPKGFVLGRPGHGEAPMLWIGTDRPVACAAVQMPDRLENLISFSAQSRAAVDAFHRAAVQAGGVSLRRPDRLEMQPGAYSAFVRDPSGNAVEACYAN